MKIWNTEQKDGTWITAKFKDFDGDVEKWRRAYFDLLSWKNTWGIPWKMDINSNINDGAFLFMLIPAKHTENVLEALDELGYRNVYTDTQKVELVTPDFDDDDDEIIEYIID